MATYHDSIIEELVRRKFLDLIVAEVLLLPSYDRGREVLATLFGKVREMDLEVERT